MCINSVIASPPLPLLPFPTHIRPAKLSNENLEG